MTDVRTDGRTEGRNGGMLQPLNDGQAEGMQEKKDVHTEGKDESRWIETDNVGFKYNRLVMFNPFLWHSNGDWFGDTYDNCRLVQLFFFHGV